MNFDIPPLELIPDPTNGGLIILAIFVGILSAGAIFVFGPSFEGKIRRALNIAGVFVALASITIFVISFNIFQSTSAQNNEIRAVQKAVWEEQFVSEVDRLYGLEINKDVAWELLGDWEFKPEDFNEGLDPGIYWESDAPVSLYHDGEHAQVELAWLGDQFALIHHTKTPGTEVRELQPAETD